jgi:hypothetical protein
MNEKLSLSEFTREDGFELSQYLTKLFDYVAKLGVPPEVTSKDEWNY